MIHLLDINVLIALCDPAHPHAAAAGDFLGPALRVMVGPPAPWSKTAFCASSGSPRYPGGPGSPQSARVLLAGLLATPGHQFWQDDLTLLAAGVFPHLPASEDLTDIYLLGLAVKHGGRFATFNARIDASIIPGGPAAYHIIPSP